jgi:hypothetical protein
VRLPEGYVGSPEVDARCAAFRAEGPSRRILVHWQDELVPLDRGRMDPILSRVLSRWDDGDALLAERTTVEPARFQEAPALAWKGVWQNEVHAIGGPMRAVGFHRGSRTYLLVGMIFSPGREKMATMRQMEAILETFEADAR